MKWFTTFLAVSAFLMVTGTINAPLSISDDSTMDSGQITEEIAEENPPAMEYEEGYEEESGEIQEESAAPDAGESEEYVEEAEEASEI